jgi:hypothetical protein
MPFTVKIANYSNVPQRTNLDEYLARLQGILDSQPFVKYIVWEQTAFDDGKPNAFDMAELAKLGEDNDELEFFVYDFNFVFDDDVNPEAFEKFEEEGYGHSDEDENSLVDIEMFYDLIDSSVSFGSGERHAISNRAYDEELLEIYPEAAQLANDIYPIQQDSDAYQQALLERFGDDALVYFGRDGIEVKTPFHD